MSNHIAASDQRDEGKEREEMVGSPEGSLNATFSVKSGKEVKVRYAIRVEDARTECEIRDE